MQELTKSKSKSGSSSKKNKQIKELAGGAFIMNQCTRCGHKWIQRKKSGQSVKCPKCKSKYWARQYERPWSVAPIKAWYEEQRMIKAIESAKKDIEKKKKN